MTQQLGRNQLKGLLDDLVLQSTEEKDIVDIDVVDEDVEEAARELLEYSSPRKRSYKQRRKRKRNQRDSVNDGVFSEEDEEDNKTDEIITIYGQQLNLSHLNKYPSLYSVCREWVHNEPIYSQNATLPKPSVESTSDSNVYCLPIPDPSVSKESSPLPTINPNEMDDAMTTAFGNIDVATLREEHISKWKTVRTKWKQKCLKRQYKYAASYKILQELCQR